MPYKDKSDEQEWSKRNRYKVNFSFLRNTDSDIIEWFESIGTGSKQGAIKDLIRAHLSQDKAKP